MFHNGYLLFAIKLLAEVNILPAHFPTTASSQILKIIEYILMTMKSQTLSMRPLLKKMKMGHFMHEKVDKYCRN